MLQSRQCKIYRAVKKVLFIKSSILNIFYQNLLTHFLLLKFFLQWLSISLIRYTLNCFTYPLTTLVLIVNVFVLIVHKSIAIFQLSITNIFSTMYDRVQKKNLRVCKKKSQRVCHFVAQQEISRPPHTLPIKVTSSWRASVEPSF